MAKFSFEQIITLYKSKQKIVNGIAIAILLSVLGIYYYFEQYKKPREEKANELIVAAQKFFAVDSFQLALNGQGNQKGFLSIIKNYQGTSAANLAYYYSGIIYLKQGQFKKAIEMLESFSSKSKILSITSKVVLADAYSENKQFEKAINLYQEVANSLKSKEKNNNFGAECLIKLGILYELQNKNEKAKETYKNILNDYTNTSQKNEAEKHLARLGETQ